MMATEPEPPREASGAGSHPGASRARRPRAWRRGASLALAGLFAASGALHLLRPEAYAAIVPHGLPEPLAIVHISGIAELACAAGLITRRRWAPVASALLLVAVFPANVQHALDVLADPDAPSWASVAAVGRLPLQGPLIWAALQGRRR